VREKRRWWEILVQSQPLPRLVFLDETGADTKMVRRYGWGPKSSRVISHVPHGHWKTTTFVAALRATGLVAPLVLDGPMNGECFLAYVQQFLIPTLQPGDIVVMDNLTSHRQSGVRETIRRVGAEVFYLPPYSPDLNPIEQAFAKLKTLLRTCAERTTEALWSRIGKLIENFSPNECLNYIKHCGYTEDKL
jgi:transposase